VRFVPPARSPPPRARDPRAPRAGEPENLARGLPRDWRRLRGKAPRGRRRLDRFSQIVAGAEPRALRPGFARPSGRCHVLLYRPLPAKVGPRPLAPSARLVLR
jgi:hypothetical protein